MMSLLSLTQRSTRYQLRSYSKISDLKISKVPKISKRLNDNHEIVSNDFIEYNIKFNIKTIKLCIEREKILKNLKE